jgi:hypothetical protein
VRWNANSEDVATIEDGLSHISDEVLATSMVRDEALKPAEFELGLVFEISKA